MSFWVTTANFSPTMPTAIQYRRTTMELSPTILTTSKTILWQLPTTTHNPQPTTRKYYCDPFGRRLWKEVNGTRTYFMYSDEGLVAEMDAAGNITKSYGYKPNSTWTTDPLFMKHGSSYYFYHNDHLGTPQKLTAISRALVWSVKCSSFGDGKVGHTSTITNNLWLPGHYYDNETDLHFNYFRYYHPWIGRYLRADSISYIQIKPRQEPPPTPVIENVHVINTNFICV